MVKIVYFGVELDFREGLPNRMGGYRTILRFFIVQDFLKLYMLLMIIMIVLGNDLGLVIMGHLIRSQNDTG